MGTRFLKSRTNIGVRDVPASIDFYARALGFEVVVSMGEPPTFAMVGADDAGLGLGQTDQLAVAGFVCSYFNVEDVDALHRRCVEAGAKIVAPLTRQPWGNDDFVIADPDGHQLAFGEAPRPSRALTARRPTGPGSDAGARRHDLEGPGIPPVS